MPRRTPVTELVKEESTASSPLRRSSRISNNSPVPTKVTTRRSSSSETTTSTPVLTRTRRSSFSQELQTVDGNATETKNAKASSTTRPRRGSFSLKNGEDNVSSDAHVTKRTTRSSSVSKEDVPDAKKSATRRRRSASQEVEKSEEAPVVKTSRTRTNSTTAKNETMESESQDHPVEPTVEVSTPIKKLDSIEEANQESESPLTDESTTGAIKRKSRNPKVDLDLSVIKETSLTEEVLVQEEGKSDHPEPTLIVEPDENIEPVPTVATEAKPGVESAEESSPISNSTIENNLNVGQEAPSNKKVISEEKPGDAKSSVNLQPSSASELSRNESEIVSSQGNKENICPRNERKDPEDEPMEVDGSSTTIFEGELSTIESLPDSSCSKISSKCRSPVITLSNVYDVSNVLEIGDKVTDEIDLFLKENTTDSPILSNKVKKSRLSLNHLSSPSVEKDDLKASDEADDVLGHNKNVAVYEENQQVATVIANYPISCATSKEDVDDREDVEIVIINSQEDLCVDKSVEDNTEESFHLELSQTNDVQIIKDDSQQEIQVEKSSAGIENVVETEQQIPCVDITSELVKERSRNVEKTDEEFCEEHPETSTKIDESSITSERTEKTVQDISEEHAEDSKENDQSATFDFHKKTDERPRDVEESTTLSADTKQHELKRVSEQCSFDSSTPKSNLKEKDFIDVVGPTEVTIETDDELEISKSDIDCTQVEQEDSSMVIEFEKDLPTTDEGEKRVDAEPLKETENSLQNHEREKTKEEESVELLFTSSTDSENKINLSRNMKSSENASCVMKDTKMESTAKKSPVNVIIKSDILIQSARSVNDSVDNSSSSSTKVSPKEKSFVSVNALDQEQINVSDDSIKNEEALEEADSTQTEETRKKLRLKSQLVVDHFEKHCSDEEDGEQNAPKRLTMTDSKYEIVDNNTTRDLKESTSSQEVLILSDNERKEAEDNEESSLNDQTSKQKRLSLDKTPIVITETMKMGHQGKRVSDRIVDAVQSLCSEMKDTENLSINLSLELVKNVSEQDEENAAELSLVGNIVVSQPSKPVSPVKRSKMRKLYHPSDVFTKINETQVVAEEFQEPSDKKVKSKLKNKKKSDALNDRTSQSPTKGENEVTTSPVKKSRSYKNTPYKSSTKKNKKSIEDKEVEEVELDLFKSYFSSASHSSNSSTEDNLDVTWTLDRSSDESEDSSGSDATSLSGSEEEEEFIIRSPILDMPYRHSSDSHSPESEEPSFLSAKSPKISPRLLINKLDMQPESSCKSQKRKSPVLKADEEENESYVKSGEETKKKKSVRKEKKLMEKKNDTFLKPSASYPISASTTVGEKKSRKRPQAAEEIVNTKKFMKIQKVPDVIITKVPSSELKVSTKESAKKIGKQSVKQRGKSTKTKHLKLEPSSSGSSSDWTEKNKTF